MEKINIAELLKDCPKGMELDCTMWDNCTFDGIEDVGYINILVKTPTGQIKLSKEGCFVHNCNSAKCVIFPKGKTTWEGFQKPFKDGDIITDVKDSNPFIFHYDNGEFFDVHCALINDYLQIYKRKNNWVSNRREFRYATEEEKQKLFDAIKANGYRWNAETKTLEKLVKPKFKVGDRIRHKENGEIFKIDEIDISDSIYCCGLDCIQVAYQDKYELVPDKFDINTLKPFDKVLARHRKDNDWTATFFSHIDEKLECHCYKFVTSNGSYPYVIPYEENKHLLSTTEDCDEFYRTWKK